MNIVYIGFANAIRWNIKRSDRKSILLKCLDGARLINPLLSMDETAKPLVFPLSKDEWHVQTGGVSLTLPAEFSMDGLTDKLAPFIRSVRSLSKQASLINNVIMTATYNISRLPKLELPHPSSRRIELIGAFRIKTALTFEHLRLVDCQIALPTQPLYEEILLDAMHAHESGDYRQAILYAAISVESMASTILQKKYSEARDRDKPPSHLNVISITQAGGHIGLKDPIFTLLTESNNFSRLLHEAPLYLFRRSMFNKDQALYASCIRLYGTRNRLSHGNSTVAKDFTVNRSGSMDALKVAISAFKWFGEEGFYAPVYDRVPMFQM